MACCLYRCLNLTDWKKVESSCSVYPGFAARVVVLGSRSIRLAIPSPRKLNRFNFQWAVTGEQRFHRALAGYKLIPIGTVYGLDLEELTCDGIVKNVFG